MLGYIGSLYMFMYMCMYISIHYLAYIDNI